MSRYKFAASCTGNANYLKYIHKGHVICTFAQEDIQLEFKNFAPQSFAEWSELLTIWQPWNSSVGRARPSGGNNALGIYTFTNAQAHHGDRGKATTLQAKK